MTRQQPSFRGISFWTENVEDSGGRRVAIHEFPMRNNAWIEDLGAKPRSFTLEGWVCGADVLKSADDLQKALEEDGAGDLVHPDRGTMTVLCTDYRRRGAVEKGIIWFSMTFVEQGEAPSPQRQENKEEAALTAADNASASSLMDFEETYVGSGVPDWVSSQSLDCVTSILSLFPSVLASFGSVAQIKDIASGYISSAALLGSFLQKSVKAETPPTKKVVALRNYHGEVPTHRRGGVNQRAILDLAVRTSLCEEVKDIVVYNHETRTEAISARKSLCDAIEYEMDNTMNDHLYGSLCDMQIALVKAIPKESLPDLGYFEANRIAPALVLAYEATGDALREGEILSRNKILHPGFCPMKRYEYIGRDSNV